MRPWNKQKERQHLEKRFQTNEAISLWTQKWHHSPFHVSLLLWSQISFSKCRVYTACCVLCTVCCRTVWCVLCAVCCVLCTVCCVLCAVYCVLCAACCVLRAVYCVLCAVYCVLCTACCVLRAVFCVLCTVFCVLCTVCCVRAESELKFVERMASHFVNYVGTGIEMLQQLLSF